MNRSTLTAFLSGLLFGIGLLLAGMANPAKVLAFLDIAGHWDPSLALVMGGAIPVSAIGFYLAPTAPRHCSANAFSYPPTPGWTNVWCWAHWVSVQAGAWPASARARRWLPWVAAISRA